MGILDKIKKFLVDRREKRKRQVENRLDQLFNLGFNKIQFPILIQDGDDLTSIHDLEHFMSDPDIYFFEFEKFTRLIDAAAKQFKWNYNFELKTNFPGEFIQQLTLNEFKEIAKRSFANSNVNTAIETAKTSKELMDILSEYC